MHRQQAIRVLLFLALALVLGQPLWAQPPEGAVGQSPSPSLTPTPSDLVKRRLELEQQLHEVEESLLVAPVPELNRTPDSPDDAPPYRTSLQRMESNLRRMLTLSENEALLQAQLEQVEAQSQEFTQRGLAESRPYPVTLLDSLTEQLRLAEEDLTSQDSALASAQVNVRLAERRLSEFQALRRRLLERSQKGQQQDLDLERRLENANWAVKATETAQQLARAETEVARKARLLAEKRRDLLRRKVSLVESHFLFTQTILQRQLDELEAKRTELNTALEQVRLQIASSLQKVKELQSQPSSPPAAVQAQTEWLTTHQRHKSLLEQQLEWNLTQRDLWERRYNLARGQGLESLSDWEDASQGVIAQLKNLRGVLQNELKQLRLLTAEVLEEPASEGGERTRRLQALSAREMALERAVRALDATSALAQRTVTEIAERRETLSWQERLRRAWASLVDLWYIEVYTIGDNSVTVGKLNVALLVLVLGLATAGRLTKLFSRRVLTRLPITDAVQANLERTLRYLFFLLVVLFALRVVNIPLTIFTFLGGTLAIAVGFGAQNILNNFISGLILLVERPVRVGDQIEVEQTIGVVEEIGARSTRVRTGSGIHVVLPNSFLLENRVVNWTLTDQRVRTSVSVGVAYGCDPAEVMAVIKRATLQTERIQKFPEPFVLLEEFADSALTFTVHFWVSLALPMNKSLAESDLRIAIERLFRQNEIPIPFPQRDLNIQGPVPVKVIEPPNKETSEE